jgi:hypothetical protein
MNDPGTPKGSERRGSLRGRLILLVSLPVVVLGISYYLFVEYIFQRRIDADLVPAERLVQAGLIALSLVLAVTCGYLILDRVTRPIRLLLRLAETGDLGSGRGIFLHHREWEIFQLYRRVSALVQQNHAGAEALAELEELRDSLTALGKELQRTGRHGISAALSPPSGAPLEEIVGNLEANRVRLLDFFAQLRQRVQELRAEADALARASKLPISESGHSDRAVRETGAPETTATFEPPPAAPREIHGIREIEESVLHLRRMGTVLALEAERVAGGAGRRVGALSDRFGSGLARLDASVHTLAESATRADTPEAGNGGRPTAAETERALRHWHELTEGLAGLERRLHEVEE